MTINYDLQINDSLKSAVETLIINDKKYVKYWCVDPDTGYWETGTDNFYSQLTDVGDVPQELLHQIYWYFDDVDIVEAIARSLKKDYEFTISTEQKEDD